MRRRILGAVPSLMVSETLTLLPSDPESVETLSAWVNDQPLVVSGPPFQITLDPEQLVDGEHALRFFTTSTKGDHMASHPLWVGALIATMLPALGALQSFRSAPSAKAVKTCEGMVAICMLSGYVVLLVAIGVEHGFAWQ